MLTTISSPESFLTLICSTMSAPFSGNSRYPKSGLWALASANWVWSGHGATPANTLELVLVLDVEGTSDEEIVAASRSTVTTGSREVASGDVVEGRVRRPGAGRPSKLSQDPGLLAALDSLVEPESRGDPMSLLRWTTKSLRNLSGELERLGHELSTATVAELLRYMGYSLQAPAKQVEGRQHPDRDGQVRYIYDRAGEFLAAGQP